MRHPILKTLKEGNCFSSKPLMPVLTEDDDAWIDVIKITEKEQTIEYEMCLSFFNNPVKNFILVTNKRGEILHVINN